jgi:hypothetical protein
MSQATFKVTVESLSNGSVHSPRINREAFVVTVEAGEYERPDAFNAAHALYRAKDPQAICPSIAGVEPVAAAVH